MSSEKILRDKMEKELLYATAELARLRDSHYVYGKNLLASEQNKLIGLEFVIEVLMRLMKEDGP